MAGLVKKSIASYDWANRDTMRYLYFDIFATSEKKTYLTRSPKKL